MKDILFYKPRIVIDEGKNLKGVEKFSHFFKLFHHDVVIVDRSGVIEMPVRTRALFPLPAFKVLTKSYEEICNERASDLLKRAESQGLRLNVFYSGGIDSTTVLVSLFKNATPDQKKNITVLLSENSIMENPSFYRDHLIGKVDLASSVNFMHLLGTNAMFVSGEHNDQVFGSDMIGKLMSGFGDDVVHEKYSRALFEKFFASISDNSEMNSFYLDLFERLASKAPVPIETNYHFLWWINFSLKWQTVYMRQLTFTAERNLPNITKGYLDAHYAPFFNTEDFQLWSMNNLDKRIKVKWNTYKWVAKDLIYDYTKDAEYRDNKVKVGSLANLMIGSASSNFVDTDFHFHRSLPVEEYYNEHNSFI